MHFVDSYLELSADILRHYFDRRLPNDFEVPGAEDLHGQDAVRLVNPEAPTKRLGHAVVVTCTHAVTVQTMMQVGAVLCA